MKRFERQTIHTGKTLYARQKTESHKTNNYEN